MPVLRVAPLALALSFAVAGNAGAADLMQAYELARSSDPQLAAAEASMRAQGEGVVQTRSLLLPQISAQAGLNDQEETGSAVRIRQNPDGTVGFGPTTGSGDSRTRSYSATLQQSLYNHSNYTRLRASRARAARAEADYDAANDALMLRVSEAYFGVLTAVDSLVFARAERRAVKRQLDQAEQRFEVGLTAITDVHEARARYDGARATAITAGNNLDDAREALAEITGKHLDNLRGLAEDFTPQLPEPADASKWVATALAQNPQLRARELDLQAAGHDVETARAGHLPTLSSTITRGTGVTWGESVSNNFVSPNQSRGYDTTIGLSLNVPIFSGFATQSQVRQALYTRDATEDSSSSSAAR